MATYLPIRAFNRSQAVRIGGQKVKSFDPTTGVGSNTYIDIDDAASRKELGYHSAIGSVFVTGSVTDFGVATVFSTAPVVSGGSTLSNTATAAGELFNRDTGAYVTVGAASGLTFTASSTSTVQRSFLIIANNSTGAVTVHPTYTEATGSTPTPPAVPAGSTAVAVATTTNGSTTVAFTYPTSYTVSGVTYFTRPRP